MRDSDKGDSDCPTNEESPEDYFFSARDTHASLLPAPGVHAIASDRNEHPLAMPSTSESSAFMTFIQKQSQQFDDNAKLMKLLV